MANAQETGASPRKGRRWLLRAVLLLVVLVIFGPIVVQNWRRARHIQPEGVVSVCRTIFTAAITYHSTYENGFPPSLVALGPPSEGAESNCNRADMMDAQLASGLKYGYIFTYRPGPLIEGSPEGCVAGAESFTLIARPREYKRGWRSFFLDESGVIHWTEENRAATADDPPL